MRRHDPVLVEEVITFLPSRVETVFDGTLWHGWHTERILKHIYEQWWATREQVTIVWIDRDTSMIKKAEHFLMPFLDKVKTVHASYADFGRIKKLGWGDRFDFMLLDLGVNMDHFKEWERGFSLKRDGPLDMRFDTTSWTPAADWLQNTKFEELKQTLLQYTDFSEKYVRWMAEWLLRWWKKNTLETTHDIKQRASEHGINDKKLAVIFQALRIRVNDELDELHTFLDVFPDHLSPWWRCAIISYHSGEDRIVKERFKSLDSEWHGKILTKKVVKPNRKEVEKNRAARSAKMRVFEKVENGK